nr:uncharacterized protein C17orf78 homolog isoform X3 [Pelodiscus sinensis]|eukprot:XP_025035089.1 uncharacterized protein C17orf78 homolog isoform X3 [Pelodiscus sinensis]
MDTILVFSLLFIYYSFSPKDLRDYDCSVENSSEVRSENTRSMNILLQVFLVGISNCIIKAKRLELDISAKQLYATAVSQQNSSSGIEEDKMLRQRQRQSIYFKAAITCILLPCALAFIVFVIFEVPIPSVHAFVGAGDATVFRNVNGKKEKAQTSQILYHLKDVS